MKLKTKDLDLMIDASFEQFKLGRVQGTRISKLREGIGKRRLPRTLPRIRV